MPVSRDIEKRQARAAELTRDLLLRVSTDLKEPEEPAIPEISDITQLPDAITQIRKKGKAHIIRRRVAKAVLDGLKKIGFLCHGTGQCSYFMDERTGILYDLCSDRFEKLLAKLTGLNKVETEFAFVLEHLKVEASALPERPVRVLSHYDPQTGCFFMHNGQGDVYCLSDCSGWDRTANGKDQIFFVADDAEAFTPDYSSNGAALEWFLDRASLAEYEVGLTRADQRTLILTTILFLLFTQETRPILVAIGPKGSGKTTFLRSLLMLLLGRRFRPTSISADRPLDDLVIAIAHNPALVVDNLDSFIRGVEDFLATYVTGTDYKRRKLYSDSAQHVIPLIARFFMISTRSPRFNRPDVADRIIPLHFEKPATGVIGETRMCTGLLHRRNAIMGDLLGLIARVVDKLKIEAPCMNFRMADFAEFGWKMHARRQEDGCWISPEWEALLGKLARAQDRFVGADNALIETLGEVLDGASPVSDMLVADLFVKCRGIADVRRLMLPKTTTTFGKLLTEMRSTIETELSVKFSEKYGHAGKRLITLTPTEPRFHRNGASAKY
jgi:energy-coupling factor transporter ATP-binding protein EcfA2